MHRKLIDLKMATMTCEEIFSLHASDTEIQICTMLTGMYRLIVGMKCIRTILLCTQPAICRHYSCRYLVGKRCGYECEKR